MKRKKNRWRPLPLSSFQIIRKSRDDVNDAINERGCERAIVHPSANSRSVVIFSSLIAIWGVNLETILYLYALLFMRVYEEFASKKRSHFWNRRRHHFIVFYQRRRRQPVRRRQRRRRQKRERNDVRRVDAENGQRPHRVLFALFQRRRVLLRGDAREEKIR